MDIKEVEEVSVEKLIEEADILMDNQELQKAYELYKIAADKGSTAAMYNIAFLFSRMNINSPAIDGIQYPKTEDEVEKWANKYADAKGADGWFEIGMQYCCYVESEDDADIIPLVDTDFVKGVKLIEKAAEQNHPGACFFLGYSYENGTGVPKDEGKADQWYKRAKSLGYTNELYEF